MEIPSTAAANRNMDVTLDGYRAQRLLRDSGACQVWEVVRVADQQVVIAKVFAVEDPARIDDSRGRPNQNQARVDHEFDMIRRLEVPGVIRAIALERTGNQLVILLEAHRGIDVGEWIHGSRDRGQPSIASFLAMAVQITRILADVHAQGVVHRDIKPANILIDPETGEVMLADFGISELLANERGRIHDRDVIEGTLPYMAPEQTGRTTRGVDFRSDLYSLGVTFYEALTGQRPFTGQSPLELIHSHLARTPTPPQRLRPELPTLLSGLVMKLLEKAPERRYQSARGLWLDLCAMQAALPSGQLGELVLARDDVPLTLRLPQQIYGREPERACLHGAFRRAISDPPQLVLLLGATGVGKTMLVDDLVEPVLGLQGFMARGRFSADSDQPLSALLGAFSTLADQLLTQSPEQLEVWRERLLGQLGSLAPVIVELVPRFRWVLGEQSVDANRSADEIRNQVRLACVRLATCIARADHPLVLALDDVQSADSATLDLLADLMAEPANVLIVLSGRESAFAVGSRLAELVVELQTRGQQATKIELGRLSLEPLTQLIADTLSRPPEAVASLAEIVARKTDSNPFFVGQLLLHLAECQLLRRESAGWTWDPEALEAATLPDDVLDMMTRKLARLAPGLQALVQTASVIGNQFDAETIAQVTAAPASGRAALDAQLLELVDEGLIAPLGRAYGFGHDRIRAAAYATVEPAERARLHLTIGRTLTRELSQPALDQRVFEIVEHLDQGYGLRDGAGDLGRLEPAELVELAELNIRAGQRSLASGAPQPADTYLAIAHRVLEQLGEFPGPTEPRHSIYVAAEQTSGQVEVLTMRFAAADARFERLLARELALAEFGQTAVLRTWGLTLAGHHATSVRFAISSVRTLGVALPAWPEQRHMLVALFGLFRLARPATLARFRSLPAVEDPRMAIAMDILHRVDNSSYMASPAAFIVLVITHAELMLRHGRHRSMPLVLAQIGMLVAGAFNRQKQGLEIVALAGAIAEAEPSGINLRIGQITCFIRMWSTAFADLYGDADEVIDRALEHGDHDLADTTAIMRLMLGMLGGQHLRLVETRAEGRARLSETADNQACAASVGQFCHRLILGPPATAGQTDPLGLLESANEASLGLFAHQRVTNAILLAIFGCWAEVHPLVADLCDRIERELGRFWLIAIARLLLGLSAAVLAGRQQGRERRRMLTTLRRSIKRFADWNAKGADHHFHEALLRAELAVCMADTDLAIQHYELAREHAARQRNPLHEALASERLASMMLDRGRDRLALGALLDARDRYQHWGAFSKVALLEQRWPELSRRGFSSPPSADESGSSRSSSGDRADSTTRGKASTSSTTNSTTSTAIDSATLLKSSQMLSEDIRLDEVVARVMTIALENAGAERGVLLLVNHDQLALAAEATAEGTTLTRLARPIPLDQAGDQVPTTIIRWVERTLEPVVLADAASDPRFQSDPHLRTRTPGAGLSVLCLPFVKRGRLVGLLYLENRLSVGSFLLERLELLRLLTAQTASALENAKLFDELRTSESRWRSLVDQLPDSVVLISRTGELEYVNLGEGARPTVTLAPRFDTAILKLGGDQAHVASALARVFAEGTREQFEVQARVPAGDLRWYSVRIAPIVVDDVIERAMIVATDISDRKQAETEREQLDNQVRQQQRLEAIGTLASGVAHEINNPIQGIMNYAELIAGSEGANEDIREFAAEIAVETDRVTTIVRDLLAFARSDHAEANKPVAVSEIVEGTLSLIRTVLRKDQISLQIDALGDLPPVRCRRQQIQQVIMNLVTNARDALNSRWPGFHIDKQIAIHAHSFERAGATWIRLIVEDQGGGIPAEVVPLIFDPFFTTKGRDQGTGLGLSVSHGIIREHHGMLVLDNRPGIGACFSIELPVG